MTRSTNQRNFVCAHYYSHSLYSNIALPERGQWIPDEIHYALMSISVVVVDLQRIIVFKFISRPIKDRIWNTSPV